MHDDRSVEEMAHEVLAAPGEGSGGPGTGESIEEALEAVLNTEAGTQPSRELRDAPHGEESVEEWQVGMAWERAEERAEDLCAIILDEPFQSTPRTAEEPEVLRRTLISPATRSSYIAKRCLPVR